MPVKSKKSKALNSNQRRDADWHHTSVPLGHIVNVQKSLDFQSMSKHQVYRQSLPKTTSIDKTKKLSSSAEPRIQQNNFAQTRQRNSKNLTESGINVAQHSPSHLDLQTSKQDLKPHPPSPANQSEEEEEEEKDNMCCHSLYIYTTCGHSTLSPKPIIECRHASIEPVQHRSTDCELITHPYQSWKLERLCPPCQEQRQALMSAIEAVQTIKFDEGKWRVSYGMPVHGKDFWGRRADERELREREREGRVEARRSTIRTLGLKRRSTRKSAKSPLSPAGAGLG